MIEIDKNSFSSFVLSKQYDDVPITAETSYVGLRICYILDGSAVWQINGKRYSVKKGDIVFFNEEQRRCIPIYGPDGFKVWVALLERVAFKSATEFKIFSSVVDLMNGIIRDSDLAQCLNEIVKEDTEGGFCKTGMILAKLTEFFIKCGRAFPHLIPKSNQNEEILSILPIIDQNAIKGISLSEAAKLTGVSECVFSRRFAMCMGVTFKRYIMQRKIKHALYLLENTNRKIVDIAFECGFDSVSGFYDTFKKITGTVPKKAFTEI